MDGPLSFEASPLDPFIAYKEEAPSFDLPEDDFFSSLERVVSRVKKKGRVATKSEEANVPVIEFEEEEEVDIYESEVPEKYRFLEALFDD